MSITNCTPCNGNLEELGGTQMNKCPHFLCTECLVKVVESSSEMGIKCPAYRGYFHCPGVIDFEELEFVCKFNVSKNMMLPEEIYASYIARIAEKASSNPKLEEDDDDDEVLGAAALVSPSSATIDLNLPNEEKECGWAHKASLIDELVRFQGMTPSEAADFVDSQPLLGNRQPISCKICLDTVDIGEGVVLKDCLHTFCKSCLVGHINNTDTSEVQCPFVEEDYRCNEVLKPTEVKGLVDLEEYERHYVELALKEAEKSLPNVFHCLTPDCTGFCIADPAARLFQCPICNARNCVACKVIHAGNCAQYWAEVEAENQRVADEANRGVQRRNEELSVTEINRQVTNRIWVRCPGCHTVIEKNGGCAHMKCRNCQRDFNWTGVAL